jgi:catalase
MTAPTRDASSFATDVVDAVNALSGRHDGKRALHAKGTLCAGVFTSAPAARALSVAAHFQGDPVRAHVRFSNGGGDPVGKDGAREARGMAVKLYLGNSTTTDLVCVTSPVFVTRTPEDFLEFMLARRPDPDTGQPDMERLGKFLGAHPEAMPAIQHTVGNPPPVSYLTCAYNSLHAYRLTAADGQQRFIRYRWEPAAGEASVAEDEEGGLAVDYLQRDLNERLAAGPARFTLTAVVAEPGDPVGDCTAAWPQERERVTLGTLEVTGPSTDRERDGDILVFDPTRVTDGIECSDDPILLFRPHAYAESVYRRSGVRRSA